jgi:hypothetical protein
MAVDCEEHIILRPKTGKFRINFSLISHNNCLWYRTRRQTVANKKIFMIHQSARRYIPLGKFYIVYRPLSCSFIEGHTIQDIGMCVFILIASSDQFSYQLSRQDNLELTK